MKAKDVAKQYGIDIVKLESFLFESKYKEFLRDIDMGMKIDERIDIDVLVSDFKYWEDNIETERRRAAQEKSAEERKLARERIEERERLNKAAAEKKAALASMLITSGFNFDGYTITKYSGYISGDDAISVDRGLTVLGFGTDVKDKLLESLVIIRRNALAELKEAAYTLGCNAVIGVDFDYLTLDPQTANLTGGTSYRPYVFGVTANGNAVIIEKNK
jgi:uncharacterized protein YbjQ (UPF0145 family)